MLGIRYQVVLDFPVLLSHHCCMGRYVGMVDAILTIYVSSAGLIGAFYGWLVLPVVRLKDNLSVIRLVT